MASPKERPILFSVPMVLALLAGRKTQTRRLLKPQPEARCTEAFLGLDGIWRFSYPTLRAPVSHSDWDVRCPYGKPGDLLWVREAWAQVPRQAYQASHDDGQPLPHRVSPDGQDWAVYRADWTRSAPSRWRPGIHMPRWASRLTLEVTEARVQRLQAITEADAQAEGVRATFAPSQGVVESARGAFERLWGEINGADSWARNPWVWVVSFEVLRHG